jgi:glycosyltransferase XagB
VQGELDNFSDSEALEWARNGLAEAFPSYSAKTRVIVGQKIGVAAVILGVIAGFVIRPVATGTVLVGLCLATYLGVVWFRIRLIIIAAGQKTHRLVVPDDDARAFPVESLPTVTVLVPAYHEAAVIGHVVTGLSDLEYPPELLQIMLLLEEDDVDTINAVAQIEIPPHIEVVVVPASESRTKPKALNYGLLRSTGDIVSVYDAEDVPDRLQLRRMAIGFTRCGPEIACIQAELSYFNADENLLTRWFAIEYRTWFAQFLPGLKKTDAPIPLGGTSNHFRREILVPLGGWDSYNVTEDADLGIRMYRQGYRVELLDSVTLEEANTDVINWIKQRSRWYKGYLQTWMVHLRHPALLYRQLGFKQFLGFNFFVGGTPALAILNPVFWFLLVMWFVLQPTFLRQILPWPMYYTGLFLWLIGNCTIFYMNCVTAYEYHKRSIFKAALLMPFYWVLMSLAAIKALWQLVITPAYWEKTQHGLSRVGATHDVH